MRSVVLLRSSSSSSLELLERLRDELELDVVGRVRVFVEDELLTRVRELVELELRTLDFLADELVVALLTRVRELEVVLLYVGREVLLVLEDNDLFVEVVERL